VDVRPERFHSLRLWACLSFVSGRYYAETSANGAAVGKVPPWDWGGSFIERVGVIYQSISNLPFQKQHL